MYVGKKKIKHKAGVRAAWQCAGGIRLRRVSQAAVVPRAKQLSSSSLIRTPHNRIGACVTFLTIPTSSSHAVTAFFYSSTDSVSVPTPK